MLKEDLIVEHFRNLSESKLQVSLAEYLLVHGELSDEVRARLAEIDKSQISPSGSTVVDSGANISGVFVSKNDSANGIPSHSRLNSRFELPNPFGKFELIEKVGSGGMGLVYKARQADTERIVALKVVRPDVWAQMLPERRKELRDRLEIEAKLGSSINHPNAVTVFETGEVDEIPFISMRYVEGKSLIRQIQTGELGVKDAVTAISTVAQAAGAFHKNNIVHRDISPRNIFASNDSDYFLGDLGLAKSLTSSQELTREKCFLGTLLYSSPEQINDSSKVDHLSDIYSLGASLYQTLTGVPPFRAETDGETINQILNAEPLSPSAINQAVGKDLEAVCLKCLEKDPRRRYQTTASLVEDLQNVIHGRVTNARPIGRAGKFLKWFRREPVVGTLATACLLLLLSVGAASAYGWVTTRQANEELSKNIQQKETNLRQTLELVERIVGMVTEDIGDLSGKSPLRRDLAMIIKKYSQTLTETNSSDDAKIAEGISRLALVKSLAQLGELDEAAAELDMAEKFINHAAAEFPSLRRKQVECAKMRAMIHSGQNKHKAAIDEIDRGLEIVKQLAQENQDVEQTVTSFQSWKAILLSDLGQIDQALEIANNIKVGAFNALDPNASRSDVIDHGVQLVNLSRLKFRANAFESRAEHYEEAEKLVSYWETAEERFPDSFNIKLKKAGALLTFSLMPTDDSESLQKRRECFQLYLALATENPNQTTPFLGVMKSANNVFFGETKREGGDPKLAVTVYEKSEPLVQDFIQRNPGNRKVSMAYAMYVRNAALVSYEIDKPDLAREQLQKGVSIYRKLLAENPDYAVAESSLGVNLLTIGELETELGNLDVAKDVLLESEQILSNTKLKSYVKFRQPVGFALGALTRSFSSKGNTKDAKECAKRAVKALEGSKHELLTEMKQLIESK